MASSKWFTTDRLFGMGASAMIVGGLSLVFAASSMASQTQTPAPDAPATSIPTPSTPAERCALPAGVNLSALSQHAADRIAERLSVCVDFESGRIDRRSYRLALENLDKAATPPLPERFWANSVIAFSSEYGADSWSANMTLGPANVYPSEGDHTEAWATLSQDAKVEFIEVAVPAGRVSGVEVYETYNPGAISHIEVITKSGRRKRVFTGTPAAMDTGSYLREVSLSSCTDEEVVAVRVTLDSAAVPGWNEIDAIAVKPCR